MPTVDSYITAFREMVDNSAQVAGEIHAEGDLVGRMLYSQSLDVRYYATLMRPQGVFLQFSKVFPQVPEKDAGFGYSITEPEILEAAQYSNAWVVMCKPPERQFEKPSFHGCKASDWYEYCTAYKTIRTPPKKTVAYYSVPVRLLKNMAGMNASQLKIGQTQ